MNRSIPRRVAVCLAAAAVVCAGMAATELPGLWLDVPFIQQQKEGCGAATLAMVMQYWSRKDGQLPPAAAEAGAIYRALHDSEKKGIVAKELARYAERAGYRVFAFAGEWQDLRQHLAKGRPLIVALQPGAGGTRHFVVVAGLAAEDQAVLVNDPARRKLERIPRGQFESQWGAMQHWTLLALPPAQP